MSKHELSTKARNEDCAKTRKQISSLSRYIFVDWYRNFDALSFVSNLRLDVEWTRRLVQTVHLYEQLRLDPSTCLMFRVRPTAGAYRVYLINEDCARCIKPRLVRRWNEIKRHMRGLVRAGRVWHAQAGGAEHAGVMGRQTGQVGLTRYTSVDHDCSRSCL